LVSAERAARIVFRLNFVAVVIRPNRQTRLAATCKRGRREAREVMGESWLQVSARRRVERPSRRSQNLVNLAQGFVGGRCVRGAPLKTLRTAILARLSRCGGGPTGAFGLKDSVRNRFFHGQTRGDGALLQS
jgi:hypothetical protein